MLNCDLKTPMVLKIQCVVRNLPMAEVNFQTFLQDYLLYKKQTAKYPAILDRFLHVLGEYQHGWVAVAGGGQDGGFRV